MSKDLMATVSGDRAAKTGIAGPDWAGSSRVASRPDSAPRADEVRLSRLLDALSFSGIAARADRLESEVAAREYSVPALEISRSMVREHLTAGAAGL
ncbi:MAG: hypothetical protein KIT09_01665 [Bryobacteraceae bacterium]|nr:hypothetical protein [Bryobacteraceae bacterium]